MATVLVKVMLGVLVAAGVLSLLLGAAHSYLGERYILMRLFRRGLPRLFGDDWFTRRTLRFAWHVTTLAWWGFAAVFFAYAALGVDAGARVALLAIAGVNLASAGLTAGFTRGRHLAWLVMLAIAVLAVLAAR